MPVSAETLRLLMEAGIAGDDLLRVVESIDRTPTKERTANAERQARHRAKKKAAQAVTDNVTSNVTESVTAVTPLARVEDNLKPTEISGSDKNKTAPKARVDDLAAFKAELSPHLDAERVEAIVKHRRSKRGQLTGHAARLFVGDAKACGLSLPEAVDACISRNWITVKPEYFRDRNRPRATDPPKKTTHASMWTEEAVAMGIIDDPASQATRRLETRLSRGPDQGAYSARRLAGA